MEPAGKAGTLVIEQVRVVVADDSDGCRELLTLVLEDAGPYRVVAAAENGDDLLDRCRVLRPDVVVVDLVMPGPDGFHLLAQLRALLPNARIIVFTGRDEGFVYRRALACGADACIDKTRPVSELVQRVVDLTG
jgi:DNA-binding NarL/FixJ family response regulator